MNVKINNLNTTNFSSESVLCANCEEVLVFCLNK